MEKKAKKSLSHVCESGEVTRNDIQNYESNRMRRLKKRRMKRDTRDVETSGGT